MARFEISFVKVTFYTIWQMWVLVITEEMQPIKMKNFQPKYNLLATRGI